MDPTAVAIMANGNVVGDGTWVLTIYISDLNMTRKFRVRGDMHIGGVMLRLVEDLDITRDWSDHALWWPKKFLWLTHTRSTLDQYGVAADSLLHFTPMHKMARIQLPDLQVVTMKLDFSIPVFNAVVHLCKELGIRHPEELSLKRCLEPEFWAKGFGTQEKQRGSSTNVGQRRDGGGAVHSQSAHNLSTVASSNDEAAAGGGGTYRRPSSNTMSHSLRAVHRHSPSSVPATPKHGSVVNGTSPISTPYVLRAPSPPPPPPQWDDFSRSSSHTLPTARAYQTFVESNDVTADHFDASLVNSPPVMQPEVLNSLFRPKNYGQKAALNQAWLDSSRSLLEQGVVENQLVQLRFKFLCFFDLNLKYDPVRINQIYEQAKWALLLEEVDCTEEEAYVFAALQLQIQMRAETAPVDHRPDQCNDDVDVLLNELENSLEISSFNHHGRDITAVPELSDYLRYYRPKKINLKSWRRAYFTLRDLYISWYPSSSAAAGTDQPIGRIPLKGCEVNQEVSLPEQKFSLKLLIPSAEGMSEFWIRCDTEYQYARWLAACKLAAKGKTMADSSYPSQVDSIRRLLDLQHPAVGGGGGRAPPPPTAAAASLGVAGNKGNQADRCVVVAPSMMDLTPEEYLPLKYAKRARSRQAIVQRILDAHQNINHLSINDAKLQYIRAWQALPEYGIHYFVVRFSNSRKPDLIAIAYNRIIRINLDTAETLKTWRFCSMKRWHVNWEIKRLFIQFEDENVEFSCLSADCKVPHEFIGGYIFCSLRSKDQMQCLNEELFHKLTGGWA